LWPGDPERAILVLGRIGSTALERDRGHVGGELEPAGLEVVQRFLRLEQDQLGEALAADLRADGRLRNVGPTNHAALLVDFAAAVRTADNEPALTDGRE